MATMILSTAGASAGSAIGGNLAGIGAAVLGRAAGGVAGALIDSQILGQGSQPTNSARLERIRVPGAGEGEAISRIFGRMRVAGQVIWASRFKEHVTETNSGGKGSGRSSTEFQYSVSFAVALCEGQISRIGRVWADGDEIPLSDYDFRLHRGDDAQLADPLIEDIEGVAPAFRGVAYLVFEDMPLAAFGNRVPQLNVEVWREPEDHTGGAAPKLSASVRAVALTPGSGEFVLETKKVRRLIGEGQSAYENVNTTSERPDVLLGLDQLQDDAPNCEAVSLVVSWFGDDLRCGRCSIRPAVETRDKDTDPERWEVSGSGRGSARVVSADAEGRPAFGGTPSDASVIRAIREMKRRELDVMFYPFILMDIPADNRKRDPWSGDADQPAFPWRGRITLNPAPGQAGSPDQSGAAAGQVDEFFGDARVEDFALRGDAVFYTGDPQWSFRRFVLHYAHLCKLAGGVDSFCIGSELRSLTQIRDGRGSYPVVRELRALAADVRRILGPSVRIGYAADWSEYFGHHPDDASGDTIFHLDPLWADDNIDFIGIDNYFPLADWRYQDDHADSEFNSVYSLEYLRSRIEGGEGYDWYYRNAFDRFNQTRTPIADGAYGEDWIFRPKDIRGWWSHQHFDRIEGVRSAVATAWRPGSKPIWFTEIGCPAVDLGANQPNVFLDPKSSESHLPHFSRGLRDDFMQRRYLQAVLTYWADQTNNPDSGVFDGRMIDPARSFVWNWDARPWPDFPSRWDVWSDGVNYRLGHWITGRLGAASLADVIAEICETSGLKAYDVSEIYGIVHGYLTDEVSAGRAALEPLMTAYAFDGFESRGVLKFRHRDRAPDGVVVSADLVERTEGGAQLSLVRAPDGDLASSVSLEFIDDGREYEIGAVEARLDDERSSRSEVARAPLLLDRSAATSIAERYLSESRGGRETGVLGVARRRLELEPGDILRFDDAIGGAHYRVDRIEDDRSRELSVSRVERAVYAEAPRPEHRPQNRAVFPAVPVSWRFLNLPVISDSLAGPAIAVFAKPWAGAAALYASGGGDDFTRVAGISRPATFGVTLNDFKAADADRWTRSQYLDVRLVGGALSAKQEIEVLNGANIAALVLPSAEVEVIQFQGAELIGPEQWRLTRFLRGQAGTDGVMAANLPRGAQFVLLDEAVVPIDSPSAFLGVERRWRIGPERKPFTDDSYSEFFSTDSGAELRPFKPAHLRALRNPVTQDITISWVRRDRINGDAWFGEDIPLSESRELYQVRLGANAPFEVTASEWLWTRQAQGKDRETGDIEIGVAQVSETFGPGPETKVTFHV